VAAASGRHHPQPVLVVAVIFRVAEDHQQS
jgi:hypothetical protein